MNHAKKLILGCVVIGGGVATWFGGAAKVIADAPTVQVRRGEFRINHLEAGEIRAARGEKVSAPRVRGDLKITHLWPEGTRVEVGDLILEFDRSAHEEWLKDAASELEKAKADRERSIANMERRFSDLQMQVQRSETGLELARISLQKAEYGSPIEKEERKIALERAERALKQAQTNLEAQEIIGRVESANIALRISHRQDNYDDRLRDYNRLHIYATRPGIVVYEKIRKRGADRHGKVMEGDVVWGGTSLLSLPELEAMQVTSQVGEMDVHLVQVGQAADIRLEAFPGPVFHGIVTDIAPMANELEDAPSVSVFEMVIDVEEQDKRLAPGMSASVKIIVESQADVLLLPLVAVFQRGERHVVYRRDPTGFETVEVEIGNDNGLEVLVLSGLQEGDEVSLTDLGLI
ncbi:MAG: efflux RND transporter periplasmic adaptor subunit [Candidatus Latescibacterota bacterium]|nr:efflux RND transporter periplasmic adaptor subunit [Candidatus Latescibacterota bacterium]